MERADASHVALAVDRALRQPDVGGPIPPFLVVALEAESDGIDLTVAARTSPRRVREVPVLLAWAGCRWLVVDVHARRRWWDFLAEKLFADVEAARRRARVTELRTIREDA